MLFCFVAYNVQFTVSVSVCFEMKKTNQYGFFPDGKNFPSQPSVRALVAQAMSCTFDVQ